MTSTQHGPHAYGEGDASFLAAGGEAGIRTLVEAFYRVMGERPSGRRILRMHPPDIEISIDKLARFLCGWLNGPKRFAEKYGPIRLPDAHAHLPLEAADRDEWLACMKNAVAEQSYDEDFEKYLMHQLQRPADRILRACSERRRPQDDARSQTDSKG